jgi:hypothetical protein
VRAVGELQHTPPRATRRTQAVLYMVHLSRAPLAVSGLQAGGCVPALWQAAQHAARLPLGQAARGREGGSSARPRGAPVLVSRGPCHTRPRGPGAGRLPWAVRNASVRRPSPAPGVREKELQRLGPPRCETAVPRAVPLPMVACPCTHHTIASPAGYSCMWHRRRCCCWRSTHGAPAT